MLRLVLTTLAVLGTTLAGCTDDRPPAERTGESGSVQAYPDTPHVTGPVPVQLRPALHLTGSGDCHPGAGLLCPRDDSGGYRVLGTTEPAVVAEVRTAPSPERTSWGTTVRFADESAGAVRRTRAEAAGIGGVVLVTDGDALLAVAAPSDLTPRRATFLGLEKAEAWSLVSAFSGSKQGM